MNDMRTFKNVKSSYFTRFPAIDQSSAIAAILLVSLGFLSVNNNDHSGGYTEFNCNRDLSALA